MTMVKRRKSEVEQPEKLAVKRWAFIKCVWETASLHEMPCFFLIEWKVLRHYLLFNTIEVWVGALVCSNALIFLFKSLQKNPCLYLIEWKIVWDHVLCLLEGWIGRGWLVFSSLSACSSISGHYLKWNEQFPCDSNRTQNVYGKMSRFVFEILNIFVFKAQRC